MNKIFSFYFEGLKAFSTVIAIFLVVALGIVSFYGPLFAIGYLKDNYGLWCAIAYVLFYILTWLSILCALIPRLTRIGLPNAVDEDYRNKKNFCR